MKKKPLNDVIETIALEKNQQQVRYYLQQRHAPATRRAYRADWACFAAWCECHALSALPCTPETLALFLAHEADRGKSMPTLYRRMAAIRLAHRMAGFSSPTEDSGVKATLSGIARVHGSANRHAKSPLLAEQLNDIVELIDTTQLQGLRDRALLLLGFAGAFRRSELVALTLNDLEWNENGLKVFIRRSKTDPLGQGAVVPVLRGRKNCPVDALNQWIEHAELTDGPIFRRIFRGGKIGTTALSSHAVALIVKRRVQQAGLNPEDFAGHSLRSGFLTSAAANQANLFKMMEVSRHKDPKTLLRYIKHAEFFENHAAEGLL